MESGDVGPTIRSIMRAGPHPALHPRIRELRQRSLSEEALSQGRLGGARRTSEAAVLPDAVQRLEAVERAHGSWRKRGR
jgi:hypothetical protein